MILELNGEVRLDRSGSSAEFPIRNAYTPRARP